MLGLMFSEGHETTAHTLCYVYALLALYPDVQEELYQHIKTVCPDGKLGGYEQMTSLTYCLA